MALSEASACADLSKRDPQKHYWSPFWYDGPRMVHVSHPGWQLAHPPIENSQRLPYRHGSIELDDCIDLCNERFPVVD